MSIEELLRQKKEQQLMMAEDIRFIENFQQKRNERKELLLMRKEDKYDQLNKYIYIQQSLIGNDNKKYILRKLKELKDELDLIDLYREAVGRPNADPYSEGISKKTILKFRKSY